MATEKKTPAKRKTSPGFESVEWRPGVKMLKCSRCDEIIEDRDAMKAHVEEHVRKG